jgi:hypothetical protein
MVVVLVLLGSPDSPALERALASAFAPAAVAPSPAAAAQHDEAERTGRGALLPLYVSFAALQVLDIHSTVLALDRDGARETNPLMAGLARRPAAFFALKAASTAGIIYLTEKVRKRHRTSAILLMTAFNSFYAAIVANNYRVAAP